MLVTHISLDRKKECVQKGSTEEEMCVRAGVYQQCFFMVQQRDWVVQNVNNMAVCAAIFFIALFFKKSARSIQKTSRRTTLCEQATVILVTHPHTPRQEHPRVKEGRERHDGKERGGEGPSLLPWGRGEVVAVMAAVMVAILTRPRQHTPLSGGAVPRMV